MSKQTFRILVGTALVTWPLFAASSTVYINDSGKFNVQLEAFAKGENSDLKVDGRSHLATKMSEEEKSEFEKYLYWKSGSLRNSECAVSSSTSMSKILEKINAKGLKPRDIFKSGRSTLEFMDKQNQEAMFPLPKYKIRQVLCMSDEEIKPAKSNVFFYNQLWGVMKLKALRSSE
ncbi:hypothetical protein [Vibrio nigripulchritudo]|uniref:hypothetical protein n=1 Tax=Vibrio nigripulchritudo TaxID=28173 RepID=UPI0003B214A7|nr:hypothetical protein [Vibrio nigripulchritudo]CCN73217.1 exported hypothetical protein [Vibrio nigripulchritudo SFn118]